MSKEDDGSRARVVDHVAIAVADLDGAADLFTRLLGVDPAWSAESTEQGVRVEVFDLGGVKIELMEGTDPASTVARFVEKRGQGLHHICYAVGDIQTALARVSDEGFEVLGSGDDIGVEGRPVAFLHPKSTGGVLTEFIEGRDDDEAE
ncbi:MAG: methylmalonyl-CoA epimerase [bacterium]